MTPAIFSSIGSSANFHPCINTIYQFIKSFLDKEMSIFEECGVFKNVKELEQHPVKNLMTRKGKQTAFSGFLEQYKCFEEII